MLELSSEELSAWRSHPTTGKFFKFLRDYRVQLAEDVATQISVGNHLDEEHIGKIALTCGIYLDLEEISFEDIKNFYTTEPEKDGEPKNETATPNINSNPE